MIYQLVLITATAITPLATFDTHESCMRELALVQPIKEASINCLPTDSPEQIQQRMVSSMKMMLDTLNSSLAK